jgi:hypothetical protein
MAALVPIRLCIYFAVTGYGYLVYNPYLTNSLMFSIGFIEVVLNFLIYVTIREERNEFNKIQIRLQHS